LSQLHFLAAHPTPAAHTHGYVGLSLSHDGRLAASASQGEVKLWNPESGQLLQTIACPRVSVAALTPDGTELVTATFGGPLCRWDPVTGKPRGAAPKTVGLVAKTIERLAMSWDGTKVATMTANSEMTNDAPILWSLQPRRLIGQLIGGAHYGTCLAFTPDGAHIISGQVSGLLLRWPTFDKKPKVKPRTNSWVALSEHHNHAPGSLSVSADGRFLLSGSSDRTARLIDLAAWKPLQLITFPGPVAGVALSQDGGLAVIAGGDQVQLWALEGAAPPRLLETLAVPAVERLAATPDLRRIMVGTRPGPLAFLQVSPA
jgi:WD40 repeat protein